MKDVEFTPIQVKVIQAGQPVHTAKVAWQTLEDEANDTQDGEASDTLSEPAVQITERTESSVRLQITCTCGRHIEVTCES